MAVTAMMIGIMCLMGFTNLGTIPIGTLSITLLGLPVAIVACVFGPGMGALLGAVWGAISFTQGVTGYLDAGGLGASLFAISPWKFALMCFLPRILAGFLPGLFYLLNERWGMNKHVNAVLCSLLVSVLNTFLFLTCMYGLFQDFFQQTAQSLSEAHNVSAYNPIAFVFYYVIFAVLVNVLVEWSVNGILGYACVYGIKKAAEKLGVSSPFRSFRPAEKNASPKPVSSENGSAEPNDKEGPDK
jgi:uncharacterized membrane protein